VAVDPATDVAWVTDENGTVIAINGATNTIERSVSLGVSEPLHVALNVSSDTIYVTDPRNSDVAVINGASGTVSTIITVGANIFGVAVDQASGTVYATSLTPVLGITWIINGSSNTIADTVARGGTYPAVDQATGTTYESSSRQDYVWVLKPSSANTNSPVITNGAGAAFIVGTAGSFTAAANALPAASFTESGALPDGVTLSPDGQFAGTPAPGSVGSYPITLTASNGTAPDFHQAFTLAVDQAPAATVASSATLQVGTPVNFPIGVTGIPAPSVQVLGDLPAGVSLTGSTVSSWQLSGTPARGSGGLYSVSFLVSNFAGSVDPPVTLMVQEAPSITSVPRVTFRTGTNRTFSLTDLGYPSPTFTETGKLPAGVGFSSGGRFSGKPGAHAGGVYPITITGSNGIGPNATQAFTMTVNQPPAFTTARQASFSAGKRHTFTIRTSGYPAAKLSYRGALPKGITFKAGPNGTAVVAGTPPRADKGKTFKITITAGNGIGSTIHETFSLKIT
jgi:large repetitive protein